MSNPELQLDLGLAGFNDGEISGGEAQRDTFLRLQEKFTQLAKCLNNRIDIDSLVDETSPLELFAELCRESVSLESKTDRIACFSLLNEALVRFRTFASQEDCILLNDTITRMQALALAKS